jgi:glycogen debranching enzyme
MGWRLQTALVGLALQHMTLAQTPQGVVPRFRIEPNPIALTECSSGRFLEASGRRAAFLGRTDGRFEAWVYPLKVLHDFELAFQTPAYADPIPGASLVAGADVRPEASTVRYAHAAFTVDATWLVPIEGQGGVVLLDVDTSVPLTVVVRFRPDLKPMWPAALGGQYSFWDATAKAYVVGEASRRHAALVGSPLGLTPPEQPAHNLPDAPSQFSIAITPDVARQGLVPIVIAAGWNGLEEVRTIYRELLANVPKQYAESFAHYRRLREELTSIDTPDNRLDLAWEWGKVAFDKGFVCNPHLGCGLVAGLGPSGTTERPGFGWFFGGDMFMNSWAMTAFGDFEAVRRSLEFLQKYQRADGKMPHEISQGAGYIRWFEEFPYPYYHGDTTPLYISALRDYVDASGDVAFARTSWESARKAFAYSLTTDEDGDGLMDNTRAGMAASETGALRRADLLTDVFLAGVWVDAARAMSSLATIVGDAAAAREAHAAYEKGRAALNRRFLDESSRTIHYALLKDGSALSERTVWPAVGLWRGLFDAASPAVAGMLDELAGSGVGADWGARMLSRQSPLYEPLSYNNGAVWPFVTGYATMALYSQGRPEAGWTYLQALGDLAFVDSCGYTPELLSGDRLRAVDAAVPHQLFATMGFMSGFARGLLGMRQAAAPGEGLGASLVIRPQLPPEWQRMTVRNLRWREHRTNLTIERVDGVTRAAVSPPVASIDAGAAPGAPDGSRRPGAQRRFEYQPIHAPLRAGQPSGRFRILEVHRTAEGDRVRYDARAGVEYSIAAIGAAANATADGATIVGRGPGRMLLRVTPPPAKQEWVRGEFTVRLQRMP